MAQALDAAADGGVDAHRSRLQDEAPDEIRVDFPRRLDLAARGLLDLFEDSGRFVVQVAALATQDKVDELQDKLKSAGIASFTQKVSTEGGSRTRIRVGPFSSKEEADRVRAKLSKIGLAGTLVPT